MKKKKKHTKVKIGKREYYQYSTYGYGDIKKKYPIHPAWFIGEFYK